MSIRNWVYIASFVGLIFGFADIAQGKPIYADSESNKAAATSQDDQKNHQESEWLAPVQDILNRIASAIEAANDKTETPEERERANRDLQAQVDMAKWAKLMLLVGGFEIAVTGVGVWLVGRTLVHTRKAATYAGNSVDAAWASVAETRKMGEAQARAYLSITDVEISAVDTVSVRYSVTNDGNSPPKNVATSVVVSFWSGNEKLSIRFGGSCNSPPRRIPISLNKEDIRKATKNGEDFRTDTIADEIKSILPSADRIHAQVWVFYDDIFDNEQECYFVGTLVGGYPQRSGMVKIPSRIERPRIDRIREIHREICEPFRDWSSET